MTEDQQRYASPTAFRNAVGDRLKTAAASRGRPVAELRREFIFQRFLARVFGGEKSHWVLKGGAGMLVRLPDGRHSQDIDLARRDQGVDVLRAVEELRAVARVDLGDHLTGNIELRRFDRFSLDLSTRSYSIGRVERIRPDPVVDVPGMPTPPEFLLYPLADQVADKVCAMYSRYGSAGGPSTRFRDLVDLALIVTNLTVDAGSVSRALQNQELRRQLELPKRIVSPGPRWAAGYPQIAGRSSLPVELHALDAALSVVGQCLDPVLAGEVAVGTWSPTERRWVGPG